MFIGLCDGEIHDKLINLRSELKEPKKIMLHITLERIQIKNKYIFMSNNKKAFTNEKSCLVLGNKQMLCLPQERKLHIRKGPHT